MVPPLFGRVDALPRRLGHAGQQGRVIDARRQVEHEAVARGLDLLGRAEGGAGERGVVGGIGVQLGIDGQDGRAAPAQPVGQRGGSGRDGLGRVAGADGAPGRVGHEAGQRPARVGQHERRPVIVEADEARPPALLSPVRGPVRALQEVAAGRVDGQGVPAGGWLGGGIHDAGHVASPSVRWTPATPCERRAMATRTRCAAPTAPWTSGLTTSSQAPT